MADLWITISGFRECKNKWINNTYNEQFFSVIKALFDIVENDSQVPNCRKVIYHRGNLLQVKSSWLLISSFPIIYVTWHVFSIKIILQYVQI